VTKQPVTAATPLESDTISRFVPATGVGVSTSPSQPDRRRIRHRLACGHAPSSSPASTTPADKPSPTPSSHPSSPTGTSAFYASNPVDIITGHQTAVRFRTCPHHDRAAASVRHRPVKARRAFDRAEKTVTAPTARGQGDRSRRVRAPTGVGAVSLNVTVTSPTANGSSPSTPAARASSSPAVNYTADKPSPTPSSHPFHQRHHLLLASNPVDIITESTAGSLPTCPHHDRAQASVRHPAP